MHIQICLLAVLSYFFAPKFNCKTKSRSCLFKETFSIRRFHNIKVRKECHFSMKKKFAKIFELMMRKWQHFKLNDFQKIFLTPRWIQTIPRIRTQHKIVLEHKKTQKSREGWLDSVYICVFPYFAADH